MRGLGRWQVQWLRKSDGQTELFQICTQTFVTPNSVYADVRSRIRIEVNPTLSQQVDLGAIQKLCQRWSRLRLMAPEIQRDDSIKRVSFEAKLVVVAPGFFPNHRSQLMSGHMIVELLSFTQKDRTRQLNRTVLPQGNSIILRPAITEISANRFIGRGDWSDDVLITKKLRKSDLDAGASRLGGLQKNESILVRDNHGCIRDLVIRQAAAGIDC